MRDSIKTGLNVSFEYPLWRTRFAQCCEALFNRVCWRSFFSETVRVGIRGRLRNWVQGQQVEGLHRSAQYARDTQRTLAAIAFRYVDATKWLRMISSLS